MKKIYIAIFLLILLFSSCNDNTVITGRNNTTPSDQAETPSEDNTDIIENSSKRLYLTISKNKNVFYIEDSAVIQTITAHIVDDNTGLESTAAVKWESNLPSSTTIIKNDNSFSFNSGTIDTLGDYTVTASISNAKKTYFFSLGTNQDFSKSLSYSFVNVLEIENKGGTIDDDGKMNLGTAIETDNTGQTISDSSQRAILQDSISYTPSGYNAVLIGAKEGLDFGLIDFESNSNSNNFDYVGLTDDNRIIVYIRELEGTQGTLKLNIKAGNKANKEIVFSLEEEPALRPADCIIYGPFSAEDLGKLVRITGDNVSNEHYQIEDGNELVLSVMRKKIGSPDSNYKTYNWSDNAESRHIQYGECIHLYHTGHYRITARVIGPGGFSSRQKLIEVIVPSYEFANPFELTWHNVDSIYTDNEWDEYTDDYQDSERSSYYTLNIVNNNSYPMRVYKVFTKNDSEPCGESVDYSTYTYVDINPNSSFSENNFFAGSYKYWTTVDVPALGYGYTYPDEIVGNNIEYSINLNKNFRSGSPFLYIESDSLVDGHLYIRPLVTVINGHLYVGEYKNGAFNRSYELSTGTAEVYAKNGEVIDNYSFKAYIHFDDNQIDSCLANHFIDVPTWNISDLYENSNIAENTIIPAAGTWNGSSFSAVARVTDPSATLVEQTSKGFTGVSTNTWYTILTVPSWYKNATIHIVADRHEKSGFFQTQYSEGSVEIQINGSRVYYIPTQDNSSDCVSMDLTVKAGDVIKGCWGKSSRTARDQHSPGYSYTLYAQTFENQGMTLPGFYTLTKSTNNSKEYVNTYVNRGTFQEYVNPRLILSSPVSYDSNDHLSID